MRSWILVAVLTMLAAWNTGAVAVGSHTATRGQSAITYFSEPTRIANVVVEGPVLIVHDHVTGHGGPCTSIYRIDVGAEQPELLTMFACIPAEREAVDKFTIKTERAGIQRRLVVTEFQFAGDCEAHGVPVFRD
jgi:hypothetical protein